MRSVTVPLEVSVTSRLAVRPSQTEEEATTRASSARTEATGTRQSRSRVRVPTCCVPRRDQLAKGFWVKYVEG